MSAFNKVTEEGSYRGTILDAQVSSTKNGFPQAILRFRAEEMAGNDGEFVAIDPAQITAYFVLFNNTDVYNEQTANLNYTQLQKVGEWEDGEFTFADIVGLKDAKAFFRTENKEYNGKTSLQVGWVDEYESSGQTTLKPATPDQLLALNSKLKFTSAAKTAAPAKRGRPAKVAVAENPTTTAQDASVKAAVPTQNTQTSIKTPPAPPSEATAVEELPTACTKTEAWEYIYSLPHNDDDDITKAWMAAIKEFGGNQKEYTPEQWAVVRDKARGKLIPF